MNADDVRALLAGRRWGPAAPPDAGSTIRFDVAGLGSFYLGLGGGRVVVADGPQAADCEILCDEPTFVRILTGEQSLLIAAMQGLAQVRGDPLLAQRLHALLRSGATEEASPGAP